ncbi:MAG: hypothetical protein GY950_11690 [bacterium]|nr:hypothetical protein [bacterium]
MKKRIITSILIMFVVSLFSFLIYGKKVATLTEIRKPRNMAIDENHFYVSERSTVFIYSLKNFKLLKKFGREGQGPQEFQTLAHVPVGVDASTDKLIVTSIRKISYYTKQGEYIDEVKGAALALRLRLCGDKFLGWSQARDTKVIYNTINLFDSKLNKLKEVYRVEDSFQGPGRGYKALPKTFSYDYFEGKILLPGSDDASIDVFDKEINKRFTIRLDQERRKLDGDFKKKMLHAFQNSEESKHLYERYLKPIIFPRYFPVVKSFFVDDTGGGTIYVLTWKRENGANEFFTYDMQGKFKKRMMIPIRYETDTAAYPVLIYKGKLYQLVDNEKNEQWELYIEEI